MWVYWYWTDSKPSCSFGGRSSFFYSNYRRYASFVWNIQYIRHYWHWVYSRQNDPKKILFSFFSLSIISLCIIIVTDQSIGILIFAILYGITDIATVAPFTTLCSKVYGEDRIGTSYGTISFFHLFGAATGSIVPGYLYNLTSGSGITIFLCVVLLTLGSLFILSVKEKRINNHWTIKLKT